MNKEENLLDTVYDKLNKQDLIKQVQDDYVSFSRTGKGKLLYRLYSTIPSKYDVDQYKYTASKQPIKIIFTGVGDSDISKISKKHFAKKYPNKSMYFFGWPQYRQAMVFASQIDPHQPVQVYGHSWGSNAARKFIQNYTGNIVQGHFFDPMRRDVQADTILQVNKNIPITYTPIYQQPRNIKTALHNALRWHPSQNMIVTQPVENHIAVDQWLDLLEPAEQEFRKAAGFLFKYGSYIQCLTKVAQQKNTKKPIVPKMHRKLDWLPQEDVTSLNQYNNINLFLNAVGDTQTQHKNIGIKGKGIYRRGSAYHLQQQALDDINNILTLPQYKKRIKDGEILPRYTLGLIHNNEDYAKQAALLYINGRVMPKVRSKFKDRSLTLDRALRDPSMRQSVYFYYTFGSDPGNRKEVNKRLGHFNAMYDLQSRRMQYQYNKSNPKTPMSLYSRKFFNDDGGRYFMYTLRPNQPIMKLGRNANHTLKILKDSGFSGFTDPRLKRLPMGYKFKYYVADNYNDYY